MGLFLFLGNIMELNFIQARSLPALQELLQELMLRLVLIPQFHQPVYDGNNWVITWYTPIEKGGMPFRNVPNGET